MVGLIEAAHNYEPQEGVIFENYARLRIKGAIVDYSASPPIYVEEQ